MNLSANDLSSGASTLILRCRFYIFGKDFDPDDCSRSLNLKPTGVWTQQREHLRDRSDLANVSWFIEKSYQSLESVSDAIEDVLTEIWPARKQIHEFVTANGNARTGVDCSVTIYRDRPIYDLRPHVIQRLADLGCEFSLDIFDYSSDDD